MVIVAGLLGGTLMALVFAAHISIMFVSNPPRFVSGGDGENNVFRPVLYLHGFALLAWPAVGVLAALAFHAARDDIPYGLFALGVLAVELVMAPALVVLSRGRLHHLAAEFAVFFLVFGVLIPVLVVSAA